MNLDELNLNVIIGDTKGTNFLPKFFVLNIDRAIVEITYTIHVQGYAKTY